MSSASRSKRDSHANIQYPEVGVCGLSCRLCPSYHSRSDSRCAGCKSEARMKVGCPFITCAVQQRGIEFCWQCPEQENCPKWHARRESGKAHDSFVCYQKLEDNIEFIQSKGISAFVKAQQAKEALIAAMLDEFNEGRSKSFYCVAATVMSTQELRHALEQARRESKGMEVKDKAKTLHSVLEGIAVQRGYHLKLRK